MIPYGHQSIDERDIEAVIQVLRSEYLTQGPVVERFEQALADYCGARYAVVASNGTAALHAAYAAIGVSRGDEFITTPITFAATANAGLWQGGRPVFVDIDPKAGNIDPEAIERVITPKTKAVVPVDYTGRPADLAPIREIGKRHGIAVVEDACQALGARYRGQRIGSFSDLSVFSFHPVKTITTGEGGAILTNNEAWYKTMKKFVTHGMTKHDLEQPSPGGWYMEMQMLGQNYRLTDIQCALGLCQLARADQFVEKRRAIASRYTNAFRDLANVLLPPEDTMDMQSAWHLYVLRVSREQRGALFAAWREKGIGVQVHHIPVYYHPYYQKLGYARGLCPEAERWYAGAISLPLYPDLSERDQEYVIDTVKASFI